MPVQEACWLLGLGQEGPRDWRADGRGLSGGRMRSASSPVAQRVPANWAPDPDLAGRRGRVRPQDSPSSEEKEAEVSMALWKFSSIFSPSSMFGPGGEDLPSRGNKAAGAVPSGTRPPRSWERPEGVAGVTRTSRRAEASPEERGVGGETSHRQPLQLI